MLKPQKDKPSKDELLNQILQEIHDENNETTNNTYQEKKSQNYNKRSSIKNIIIGIFTIIAIIIFVFFLPSDETKKIENHETKKNMLIITEADQLAKQKEQAEIKIERERQQKLYREEHRRKTAERKAMEDKKKNTDREKILNVENQKTEREIAKEILMKQMQD